MLIRGDVSSSSFLVGDFSIFHIPISSQKLVSREPWSILVAEMLSPDPEKSGIRLQGLEIFISGATPSLKLPIPHAEKTVTFGSLLLKSPDLWSGSQRSEANFV